MMRDPLTVGEFIKAQDARDLSTIDRRWFYDSLILVAVVLGLIFLQPFGLNEIGSIQRITYWTFISMMGYCLYGSIFILGGKILPKVSVNFSYPFPVILCGFVASILMALVVMFAGSIFFDIQAPYGHQFLVILPQTLTIGILLLAVTVVTDYITEQNKRSQLGQNSEVLHKQATDAFLQNIPIKMRGELLCLETEDHYLRVHTNKGHHLLLMRFRDAMAILEDAKGGQVHRSWWVADSAVIEALREGRKISLLLKNDVVVPVSRKFSSDVKDRNFLK